MSEDIYILAFGYDYEGYDIVGVFQSLYKAKSFEEEIYTDYRIIYKVDFSDPSGFKEVAYLDKKDSNKWVNI